MRGQRSTSTGTAALIETATAARAAFDMATANSATAAQALRDAVSALQDANQALHDDLDTNGPAVVIDQSTTPFTVLVYTAADPDSYAVKEIRIA